MNKNQEKTPAEQEISQTWFVIGIIVCAALLVWGIITTVNDFQLRIWGNRVTGQIIDVHYQERGNVWLTVTYEVDGREFRRRVRGRMYSRNVAVNVPIQLFYCPENPGRVTAMKSTYLILFLTIFCVLPATVLAIYKLVTGKALF